MFVNFNQILIMASVIIASAIIASVIMASVIYGKCYLWQMYYGKCNYGKSIMANETEPFKTGSLTLPWFKLGNYTYHG